MSSMTGPAMPPVRSSGAPDGARARRAGAARGGAARGGWLPYLFALGCALGGLAWMWVGGAHAAKRGTLALAGAMFTAALARLVLPESRIGMLASRKRFMDVITLTALGSGLLAAGLLLSMTT